MDEEIQVSHHGLKLATLGIDTRQEHVIYMRRDCHICRAEGFEAQSRVEVSFGGGNVLATVNVVDPPLLKPGEAALSLNAVRALGVSEGSIVEVSHAPVLESLSAMRSKVYGHRLSPHDLDLIISDIARGRYSDIHIAAFLSACAGGRMDIDETVALTASMVKAGDRLDWGGAIVADKHCVGGLPGNRTTPIVVAIVAAAGLLMPKTSSRAITSPAGTADVMETLTRVDLDLAGMRRVVEQEGGCIVWGGSLTLSPADDVLIRVERPLDIDSDAQLVASVLSKKIAAGSTHAIIDIPVGPTAKVRTQTDAENLSAMLLAVGQQNGLHLRILQSDGTQPVGRGIGPALEALDVIDVLQGSARAPADLKERAVFLAGILLEHAGHSPPGAGGVEATRLLESGQAWRKFQSICMAQGGLRQPPVAAIREVVTATVSGTLAAIDSRRLARVAKLAGAPNVPAAGLELHVRVGDRIEKGMPLLTLHSQAPGELSYARQYLAQHDVFSFTREGA